MSRLIGLFQIVGGASVSSEVMKFKSFAARLEMWVVFSVSQVRRIRLRIDSRSPFG